MDHPATPPRFPRVLVVGLVSLLVLVGFIIIIRLAGIKNAVPSAQPPDVLANSSDECVVCHRQSSPGIVQEYGHSKMAAAKVGCTDCHEVASTYPGAVDHEGTFVLASPTTAKCQRCHPAETAQYLQSRHSLPAYVAWAGSKVLSPDLLAQYKSIPEGTFAPDTARNALAVLEGGDVTTFAC